MKVYKAAFQLMINYTAYHTMRRLLRQSRDIRLNFTFPPDSLLEIRKHSLQVM